MQGEHLNKRRVDGTQNRKGSTPNVWHICQIISLAQSSEQNHVTFVVFLMRAVVYHNTQVLKDALNSCYSENTNTLFYRKFEQRGECWWNTENWLFLLQVILILPLQLSLLLARSPQEGSWKWVNSQVADLSEAFTSMQPLYILVFKGRANSPDAPNFRLIKISHILWNPTRVRGNESGGLRQWETNQTSSQG